MELQGQIEALYAKKQSLEADLATKTSSQNEDSLDVDADQLRGCLPENVALVDYFEFHRKANFVEQLLGQEQIPAMVAFVTTPNREVELFDLGDTRPIYQALAEWLLALRVERNHVGDDEYEKIVDAVGNRGTTLRRLIWSPIRKRVSFAKTIVISPDGVLNTCPFAALPTASRREFLVEEHELVSTVAMSSLPEFLRQEHRQISGEPGFLVVEHVNYGKPEKEPQTEEGETQILFQPLQAKEAKYLSESFSNAYPKGKIAKLSGGKAREDLIKKAMPRCRFVHLSTHGFCLYASDIQLFNVQMSQLQEMLGSLQFDPLVSGVALAYANKGIVGEENVDGILWADEIASLDLHNAELVTLSACETVLGSYASGEGMLGCQRALYVAGANAALGTRWAVEDRATSVFMAQFYRNLWEKKMTKAEALQSAMKFMIREYPLDEEEKGKESLQFRRPPIVWAGFVLTGDWR